MRREDSAGAVVAGGQQPPSVDTVKDPLRLHVVPGTEGGSVREEP